MQAIWEAMGRPKMLNRAEVASITAQSAVRDEPQPFEWADGCAQMDFEMGVNDVYLVSLR